MARPVALNRLEASGLQWLLLMAATAVVAADDPGIRFAGRPYDLVLSEVSARTVRIELIPRGEPRPTVSPILVGFPCRERLRLSELGSPQESQIGGLRVLVRPNPLTLVLQDADGRRVQELSFDSQAPARAGVSFSTDGPVFGLGEGAQQFDRRGALYPMEPTWGGWNRPVLGSVVPSPFLLGTDGWALFVHHPEGAFDLRGARGQFIPRATAHPLSGLDLFIIAWTEPSDALGEYIGLTGKPMLPPKWALGYLQSHRTLAGPGEAVEVAQTFRRKGLPCDGLIYLGTGYCTNGWNTGHGSLNFNLLAFPPENIEALHDLDFKVVLHVNRAPRNLAGHFGEDLTPSPASAKLAESTPVPLDNGSEAPIPVRDYWARHRDVFRLGVDGWWPDDGDELPLEARLIRHECYCAGPLQDRPGVRPWSLHRTGYAGAQRFGGWIWSGDVDSTWPTLAAQVSVGLNHGLSLTPFWGTDTGGFFPTPELTGELYVRWFQFSAFCPLFRSHGRTWHLRLPWGWGTGEFGPIEHSPEQHPDLTELRNGTVEPICRRYLELRYRLLPYNYSLVREACDSGLPLMRPLWLHDPLDSTSRSLGGQYLWGPHVLVAPVTEPGARSRRVYLPNGTWFDWWTGETVNGGRWVERPVDLATLPLYVRSGAIIPLDPVRQFTAQARTQPTVFRVFPGADGDFTFYDDDGFSLGHRDGSDPAQVWIHLRWEDALNRLTLRPDPRATNKGREPRVFRVERAGRPSWSERVEFRGEPVTVPVFPPDE